MVEIYTWDEVFRRKKGSPNLIFLTLYWYLFNKIGCQTQIVEDMRKLKEMKEFKDIPASVCEERNVTRYIRKMEEYNLISIREIKNRRFYYQALSFFYIDRFCIKLPKLRGRSELGTFKEHYREYKKYVGKLKISLDSDEAFLSFNTQRDNSVVPAQELVATYSSEPREFMKHLFLRRKRDYINLYFLILKTFEELWGIIEFCYSSKKEITSDFSILSTRKILETDFDTSFLVKKSRYLRWSPEENRKVNGKILRSHLGHVISHMSNYVVPRYESLELGYSSFNKETLEFEDH